MKKRTIFFALGALSVTGIAAAFGLIGQDSGPRTAEVLRQEFSTSVEATGTLEAAVAFEVGPPSVRNYWNYNLSWMIPEGSRVQEGDVIARFDATQIEDRLRDHRAELEKTLQEREKEQRNLEVELRRLRLDLVKAEGDLQIVDLDLAVPEGLVSFIELEQTRLKKELAQRRVSFLREKIEFEQELVRTKLELLDVKAEFSQGKIDYNETALGKFEVQAPVSGMVVYVPKPSGDRWEVGESVWMLAKLLKVADISTLQVEANILEVDAAKIAPGQSAEISIDAVPGMILDSSVQEIGQIVHERSLQDPSKVFDAILPLDEFDNEILRPGMGIQVRIETARLADRLSVPLGAVRSSGEGPYVEVRSSGRSERRNVVLGQRNADRVVVESGVEEGERVLLESTESGP